MLDLVVSDWGGMCQGGWRQSPVNILTHEVREVTKDKPLHFHNYDRMTRVSVTVDHHTGKPDERFS